MNATSCVLAVFSPTGGTEKIARAVGHGTKLAVGAFLKASAGRSKQPELFL